MAALPDSHPAKRLIIAHAECWRDCAGRELPWKDREAVDQVWDSKLEGRQMTFSGLVYEHICFDLVLEPWPERPPALTDYERWILERLPRLRRLMDECQRAATTEDNHEIIKMVGQVREYLDLWDEAIIKRMEEDGIRG